MKTSKSFNQEYIEKAKTLIHEILEDKKEYDDWTQICFSMQNAVQAAANIWGISSDEQINKMRSFITEMVFTELSNLKQFDIVFKKKGAQVELELYILCQIILGIGWDANKMGKWFWQSNKDRDLVILKNWVTVEK